MRVRLRYTKTDKVRFVSAIDLGRLWERALRRADLPIAYSEGFSPHPRISFPDALPLGYASTGEYAELTFAAPVDLPSAMAALNAAFPEGLRALQGVAVAEGDPKLARWLSASCWQLDYRTAAPGLEAAVATVRGAREVPVGRERKGVVTQIDLRPAIHQISTNGHLVRVTLHHVEPPVRPSEVHLALQHTASATGLADPALVTRIAQGTPVSGGLTEALGGDLVPPLQDLEQKAMQ